MLNLAHAEDRRLHTDVHAQFPSALADVLGTAAPSPDDAHLRRMATVLGLTVVESHHAHERILKELVAADDDDIRNPGDDQRGAGADNAHSADLLAGRHTLRDAESAGQGHVHSLLDAVLQHPSASLFVDRAGQ